MTLRPLALVLLLAAAGRAQFVYGLNIQGKLTLNGTVLDSLPSGFDPSTNANPTERWWDLEVVGADRYALRLDGRVQKNGAKLFQLPMATNGAEWIDLDATANGVHMLRQDGERALAGTAVVTYPFDQSIFTALAVQVVGSTDTAFAMRGDGTIFSGTSTTAVGKFTASGLSDPPDGTTATTFWTDLAVDADNAQLLGIRTDGHVFKIAIADLGSTLTDTGPTAGVPEATLPPPTSTSDSSHFYSRIAVTGGSWRVLRFNGEVYSPASVVTPLVDYDGTGTTTADFFVALAYDGTDLFGLRSDGKVYENLDTSNTLFNLVGDNYRMVALGTQPPDLSHFKNPPPKASPYTVTVVENAAVSVPVIVSDIEKLSDNLVVTTNPDKPLPAGATFSEIDDGFGHLTRTIEWDGTQPIGTYKCPLMVSDGVSKPHKFIETIKVVAADTDPLKNKPPKVAKVKPVQALVGHEIRIPILATDLDGDALTFSVNDAKSPFTLGATFDTLTNEIVWTPTFDDIGTVHPKVLVSDGIKTSSVSVTVKVVNSLVFE